MKPYILIFNKHQQVGRFCLGFWWKQVQKAVSTENESDLSIEKKSKTTILIQTIIQCKSGFPGSSDFRRVRTKVFAGENRLTEILTEQIQQSGVNWVWTSRILTNIKSTRTFGFFSRYQIPGTKLQKPFFNCVMAQKIIKFRYIFFSTKALQPESLRKLFEELFFIRHAKSEEFRSNVKKLVKKIKASPKKLLEPICLQMMKNGPKDHSKIFLSSKSRPLAVGYITTEIATILYCKSD